MVNSVEASIDFCEVSKALFSVSHCGQMYASYSLIEVMAIRHDELDEIDEDEYLFSTFTFDDDSTSVFNSKLFEEGNDEEGRIYGTWEITHSLCTQQPC